MKLISITSQLTELVAAVEIKGKIKIIKADNYQDLENILNNLK